MSIEGISIAARTLLTERIDSVAQLEALLLLHALAQPFANRPNDTAASPESRGARDAVAVAGALRIAESWSAQILEELVRKRLLVVHEMAPPPRRLYRFPIEDAALRGATDELRAAYAERRVSVISLIFSKSPDPLRSFSDAFRLRPGKEPPP